MSKTVKFIPIIIGSSLLLVGCWSSGVRPLQRGEVRRMVGQYNSTSPVVVPEPKKRTSSAFEQSGDALYLRREWMGALYQYHRAFALKRKSARLLTKIGLVYLKMGNIRQAEDRFRKALALKADSPVACQGIGIVLMLRHQGQKAETYLKRAVALGPRLWKAWNFLGIYYNTTRRFAEAKACFEKAIKVNPRHAGLVNNLGLSMYLSGDLDGAERMFQRAIAMNPKNARFHNNLALVYARRGQFDQARQSFVAGNGPAVAANNMGVLHLLQGNRGAAANDFARALEAKTSFYVKAKQNLKLVPGVTPTRELTLDESASRPVKGRRIKRARRRTAPTHSRRAAIVERTSADGATRGF
jgi:Flp pilus assembly protein TadD